MATFPRTEPQILTLAQEMVTGLTANAATYPDPPEAPANLTTKLTAYTTARNAAVAAQAAAAQATATKDDALTALADAMKRDIRYAENTADGGQCRTLEARRVGVLAHLGDRRWWANTPTLQELNGP